MKCYRAGGFQTKMPMELFTSPALQAQRLSSPSVWGNGIVQKILYIERESTSTARERGQHSSAGMAETVHSLFDYRDPPPLDSNGESSKLPQPRGWGSEHSRDDTDFKAQKRLTEITSLFCYNKMIVITNVKVFFIVVGNFFCNQN